MPLINFQPALRQQVSYNLEDGDIVRTAMPYLGMLLGFDDFNKTPARASKSAAP